MHHAVVEHGRAGDQLVVEGVRFGTQARVATIVAVHEEGDVVMCLIRWADNGRELRLVFRKSSAGVKLIDR